MADPRVSESGGAQSWGPTPTGEVQGLDALIQRSAKLRDAVNKQASDFLHRGPWGNIPLPGGSVAADPMAKAVEVFNPIPGSKTDVALSAIPFAAVWKDMLHQAPQVARVLFDENVAEAASARIMKTVQPKVMKMLSQANKAGIQQMDEKEATKWLYTYLKRGVRDVDGKVWWGEPEDLHDDIISMAEDAGAVFPDDPLQVERLFNAGGEVLDYDTGYFMDYATGEIMRNWMKHHYGRQGMR